VLGVAVKEEIPPAQSLTQSSGRKMEGKFFIHREIFESDVWEKPAYYLKVWIWIIGKANWKTIKKGGKTYHRGEFLTSYEQIIKKNSWKIGWRTEYLEKDEVFDVLEFLRKTQRITTKKTTKGLWIKVIKYDEFQKLNETLMKVQRKGTEKATAKATEKAIKTGDESNNESNNESNRVATGKRERQMKESFKSKKEFSFKKKKEELISEILAWEKENPPVSNFPEKNKRKFLNDCVRFLGLEEMKKILDEVETSARRVSGYYLFVELLPQEMLKKKKKKQRKRNLTKVVKPMKMKIKTIVKRDFHKGQNLTKQI